MRNGKGQGSADERVPPHSIEAEQAVLASAMISAKACEYVLANIKAADFYHYPHAKIFAAIQALDAEFEPADLLTVPEQLKRTNDLGLVGGIAYLNTIINSVPTAVHHVHYCGIVLELAARRRLIEAGTAIATSASDTSRAFSDVYDGATTLLGAAADNRKSGSFERVLDGGDLEQVWRDATDPAIYVDSRVMTKLPTLDKMTKGLRPGSFWIVAGRPSMGKSDFCLSLVVRLDGTVPCLIVSLEMSKEECLLRLVSSFSGMPYTDISAELPPERIERLRPHFDRVITSRIRIADRSDVSATPEDVHALVSCFKARYGYGLVIIDQASTFDRLEKETEVQQAGRIAYKLQSIAKSLGIPTILQVQLNRDNVRDKRRPGMADLRNNGNMEQAADAILLLHRESYGKPDEPVQMPVPTEVILAKQRQGPVGVIMVAADLPKTRWYEIDNVHEPVGFR